MSIPGSRPKTIIKKTNYNNPSLSSYSVIQIFNPQKEVASTYKKYNNYDSLKQAQIYYDKQKQTIKSQSTSKSLIKKQSNTKIIQNNNRNQQQKWNRLYNYINTDSIKYKQFHGFNIINNISFPEY